jgi:cell division inhibitor SulA/protein ImuA
MNKSIGVPESSPFAAAIEYSHPKVFRIGGMGSALAGDTMPTGFAALDAELAGGGWQRPGLTEILCNHVGIGELSLLMRGLGAGAGMKSLRPGDAAHVLWVLPPGQAWVPYAPALARGGVSLAHLAIVRTKNSEDALWAAEQGLKSGACRAVLLRLNEIACNPLSLRRLQQAAAAGNSIMWLLRPLEAAASPSPAGTRITLQPMPTGAIKMELIKRRGLPQGKSLIVAARSLACLGRDARPVRVTPAKVPKLPNVAKGQAARWLDQVLGNQVPLTEPVTAGIRERSEQSITRERG